MPTGYIRKMAEQGHGTIAELEKKWDEAKAKAKEAGQADNFAYVTSIFQNLAHIKKASIDTSHQSFSMGSMQIKASSRLKAYAPQGPVTSVQPGGLSAPMMTTGSEPTEEQEDEDLEESDLTPDEFVDIGESIDNYSDERQVEATDNAYLDSLVNSGQFTREQVDTAWEKAKKIANKNAKANPDIVQSYAYTTGIFQDILGIKQKAMQLKASSRLKASK